MYLYVIVLILQKDNPHEEMDVDKEDEKGEDDGEAEQDKNDPSTEELPEEDKEETPEKTPQIPEDALGQNSDEEDEVNEDTKGDSDDKKDEKEDAKPSHDKPTAEDDVESSAMEKGSKDMVQTNPQLDKQDVPQVSSYLNFK